MSDKWDRLKDKIREEKAKARGSLHEQAHIKLGILCLVESWIQQLEEDNGQF